MAFCYFFTLFLSDVFCLAVVDIPQRGAGCASIRDEFEGTTDGIC